MELLSSKVLRVQAGANWKKVLDFLHPRGLSVAIMQSDYDFSVGGSVASNVHGWQVNSPPISASIRGLQVMLASGEVMYCNRNTHADLFSGIIGGYGVLGVVLSVDLDVVENKMYHMKHWVGSIGDALTQLKKIDSSPMVRMFFGRFNLMSESFLQELVLVTYEETEHLVPDKKLGYSKFVSKIIHWMFGHTYNSNSFQKLRWKFESKSAKKFSKSISRNQLLYHGVDSYVLKGSDKIDLLQEYFVPIEKINDFVLVLQEMQRDLKPHLMNITLRQVCQDVDSVLNYATGSRLCFVMFFRGDYSKEFDAHISKVSRQLTEKVMQMGGSYYLPYRPYQTLEQFYEAYPGYKKIQELKKQYDSKNVFINEFYKKYLKSL